MKAHHHDFQGALAGKLRGTLAQEFFKLVVYYFYNKLPRRDGLDDLAAYTFRLYPLGEFPGNFKMHIRRQQSLPDFVQSLGHILVGKFAYAAQIAQSLAYIFGE